MRDKVTRQCPQTTTFEEKEEPKRIRTEVHLPDRRASRGGPTPLSDLLLMGGVFVALLGNTLIVLSVGGCFCLFVFSSAYFPVLWGYMRKDLSPPNTCARIHTHTHTHPHTLTHTHTHTHTYPPTHPPTHTHTHTHTHTPHTHTHTRTHSRSYARTH